MEKGGSFVVDSPERQKCVWGGIASLFSRGTRQVNSCFAHSELWPFTLALLAASSTPAQFSSPTFLPPLCGLQVLVSSLWIFSCQAPHKSSPLCASMEGHSAWHMWAVQKVLNEYPWILNMTLLKLRTRGGQLVVGLGPEWIMKWPQLPVTWGFWGFIHTQEMNEREVN